MCFECSEVSIEGAIFRWKIGAASLAERDSAIIAAVDPERLDEHLAGMPANVADDFRAFLLAIFDGVDDVYIDMAHAQGMTEDRGWGLPYPMGSQLEQLARLLPAVRARRVAWMMGLETVGP